MTTTDSAADSTALRLEHDFADQLPELGADFTPAPVPSPNLVAFNVDLAEQLGLDASLSGAAGAELFAGNTVPPSSRSIAMAYAGHQFGGFSPLLGDGRAALLGEIAVDGDLHDIHLKGSGRTPFARGGDGKATIAAMLREFVMAEAMQALGISTTRALAVVTTGELVHRDGAEPGAVLTRVASSHLRVGTFQYAAQLGDPDLLKRLADYTIQRHWPDLADTDDPYLELLRAVTEAQAALVASWMLVGFIHGVMNTDNVSIPGETIDYGPCAFMDRYDPATVYSSIDHAGRYAYGNQPSIAQWNLARFAESLLTLIDDDTDRAIERATEVLNEFPERYRTHRDAGLRLKLGLTIGADTALRSDAELDVALGERFLELLAANRADFTSAFRALSDAMVGDDHRLHAVLGDDEAVEAWLKDWNDRIDASGQDRAAAAQSMLGVNPVYIPRNHLVDEALSAATAGDLTLFERLLGVVTNPYEERDDLGEYAEAAPASFDSSFQTFCGT